MLSVMPTIITASAAHDSTKLIFPTVLRMSVTTGEVNGKKGAWGHSVGGMGKITEIMAKVAKEAGVEISLESPVAKVLVDGNKAAGVKLVSGEEITASRIIAAFLRERLLVRREPGSRFYDGDIVRLEMDHIGWLGLHGLRMEPWFGIQSIASGVWEKAGIRMSRGTTARS